MSATAQLTIGDKSYELPVIEGTEGEKAIDISKLRDLSGYVTLDVGYKNTGATKSAITFLDGEEGILLHQKLKAAAVNRYQFGVGAHQSCGDARAGLNQGHLPKDSAGPNFFHHLPLDDDIDGPVDHRVHNFPLVAFLKHGLSGRIF